MEVLDISYCYHGDDEPLPILMDCSSFPEGAKIGWVGLGQKTRRHPLQVEKHVYIATQLATIVHS